MDSTGRMCKLCKHVSLKMVLDNIKSTDRGESNTIERQFCLLIILVACVTTRLKYMLAGPVVLARA